MKIKRAQTDNIEEILKIEKESFDNPWTYDMFFYELEQTSIAEYYILEIEQKIVAYCGFWYLGNSGHITSIAVLSSYREKGVGSKMLNMIMDRLSEMEVKQIRLEVACDNIEAISMYKKYGFVIKDFIPKYYENKKDAYLMLKNIN